ncbi:MAG: hypothetical protein JWR59_396 [Brevundimonas sp.]|nr:hypothetical protein [Brevundimonas sp.]
MEAPLSAKDEEAASEAEPDKALSAEQREIEAELRDRIRALYADPSSQIPKPRE